MNVPLKKNDDIELMISGMTAEGAGVGRHEGFAVFVTGALPGETVRAHIIKVAKSYAVGKLMEVITPSSDRTEPLCSVFPKCGGCSLQHMSYGAQLRYKRSVISDALERIGGFEGIEVKPVIGMDDIAGYRNKGSFPFAEVDGKLRWGLYSAGSHRLIAPANCMIEDPAAVAAANAVQKWAERYSVPAYDELTGKGVLRHVVTRRCTGGASVCVVTTGSLPHSETLIKLLIDDVPGLASVVHNINSKSTNVICGTEYRTVFGADTVRHSICGLDFNVSAESFLQVNTAQTEKLYSAALDALALTGEEDVADLFCGIGTISLLIAKKAKSVTGIEYVEKAIENARDNAQLNGIDNAEFFTGAAEDVLPRLVADGRRFDCVCLDPPRKGADIAALDAIAESGAKRIVYVSCDPATLARDLKILCENGYGIVSVQPVDMFPMTGHVECVVLMSRVKG